MKAKSRDDESDGQLIRRFVEGRDQAAFAALVKRRGALVAGVCARMLRNRADAEDAFQAVFLVLARRAHAVRRCASLAGWLHNVAVRVCLNERRGRRRRQRLLQEAGTLARVAAGPEQAARLKLVIDEELAALPRQLREVLVLCDLEGRTHAEVGRTLSVPVKTVSSRLARGRAVMRKRLARLGLSIAAGSAAPSLSSVCQAAPAVSAELVRATVRSTNIFLASTAEGRATLGLKISSLAEGVLHAMVISQWKTGAALVGFLMTMLFGGALAPTALPKLTATATAAPLFVDEFTDGSVTDGNPVTWLLQVPPINLGTFAVTANDLVLSPATSGPITYPDIANYREMGVRVEDRVYHDVDVRTRIRTSNNGVYVAGIGLLDTHERTNPQFGRSVNALIVFDGARRYLELNLEHDFTFPQRYQAPTSLSSLASDLNLRLRIAGDQASYWAWEEGQPEPQLPQLTAQLPPEYANLEGYVGLIAGGVPTANPITFRFVAVVAEPSSRALAATVASMALVLGGRRLGRRELLL